MEGIDSGDDDSIFSHEPPFDFGDGDEELDGIFRSGVGWELLAPGAARRGRLRGAAGAPRGRGGGRGGGRAGVRCMQGRDGARRGARQAVGNPWRRVLDQGEESIGRRNVSDVMQNRRVKLSIHITNTGRNTRKERKYIFF